MKEWKENPHVSFKNQIKCLKFGDCYLKIDLLRTAHLEDKRENIKDDFNNFGVLDGKQIHQWFQDARVDKLDQLV